MLRGQSSIMGDAAGWMVGGNFWSFSEDGSNGEFGQAVGGG